MNGKKNNTHKMRSDIHCKYAIFILDLDHAKSIFCAISSCEDAYWHHKNLSYMLPNGCSDFIFAHDKLETYCQLIGYISYISVSDFS